MNGLDVLFEVLAALIGIGVVFCFLAAVLFLFRDVRRAFDPRRFHIKTMLLTMVAFCATFATLRLMGILTGPPSGAAFLGALLFVPVLAVVYTLSMFYEEAFGKYTIKHLPKEEEPVLPHEVQFLDADPARKECVASAEGITFLDG